MEHETQPRARAQAIEGWTVLLGPGARLRGLEPLLLALGSSVGESGHVSVGSLADVSELLPGPGGSGRLILDADEVPTEDIGFVRRFLMDNPGWSLLLLGLDAGRQTARTLLSLPRAGWLAWPPDLEQMRELTRPAQAAPLAARAPASAPGSAPASIAPIAAGAPELERRSADISAIAQRLESAFEALRESARLPEAQTEGVADEIRRLNSFTAALATIASPPQRGNERFDLDALLEEELAVLALRQRKAPRFKYRGGAALEVRADRTALTRAFECILRLARGCAAEGQLVRVSTARADGEVQVDLDFPAGPIAGLDPAELFEPGALGERIAELGSHELAAARALVRSQGGELETAEAAREQVALRMRLPSAATEPVAGAKP